VTLFHTNTPVDSSNSSAAGVSATIAIACLALNVTISWLLDFKLEIFEMVILAKLSSSSFTFRNSANSIISAKSSFSLKSSISFSSAKLFSSSSSFPASTDNGSFIGSFYNPGMLGIPSFAAAANSASLIALAFSIALFSVRIK